MQQIWDVVIIGSGPAGMAAGIYAKRAGLSSIIIEKTGICGGQVLSTYEVDNYPGLPMKSGFELSEEFRMQAERLGVTVNTKTYQVSWIQTLTIIQVADISPNGSAANSGLQVGDILCRYEGVDITSFEILSQQLTKYSVGDTIKLTVLRPTIELTDNNLQQYINTAKEVEIPIPFTEFNPNA